MESLPIKSLKSAGCAILALLLTTTPAFPSQVRAASLPNAVVTPVQSGVDWIAAPVSVTDDFFTFDASFHFPQLSGAPVNITAVSATAAAADATVANGIVRVQVKSAGTARLAITGTDASLSSLTDHIEMKVTLLGDTNGDGVLTSADVLYIYKVINSKLTPSEEEKNRLDTNRDGQISTADATLLMSSYVGKTPVTGGVKFIVKLSDFNDAPIAGQLGITGSVQTGQTLTGTYLYLDPENHAEGASVYQWYRGTMADGSDKAAIAGATGTQYTVRDEDVDHYLFFEVMPADDQGALGTTFSASTTGLVLDTTAPTLQTVTPADGETNVDLAAALSLTFSEPVQAVSGKSLSLRRMADDNLIKQYTADDTSEVVISGTTVSLTNPGLSSETDYYVQIDQGAFQDRKGNAYAGYNDSTTWNFRTKDVTMPLIDTKLPVNQAADVHKSTALTLTFNENVAAGAGKKITIYDKADDSVIEAYDAVDTSKVDINGSNVTIANPGLDEVKTYYVVIDAGALVDLSGNPFAGMSGKEDWTFTTKDLTAPELISTTPADDATGVSRTADLTFALSEPVQAVAAKSIRIRRAADDDIVKLYAADNAGEVEINGSTVTLKNPNMDDGANLYVDIDAGAFEDLAGNDFAGLNDKSVWSFTTVDTIAPTVSSTLPADDAAGISRTADLSVTFNEQVVAVNGKAVTVRASEDDAVMATYTLGTDTEVSVTGNTMTISHDEFASLKDYYVEIESGAVQDLSNNAYDGMSVATTWNFQTMDSRVLTAGTNTPLKENELSGGAFLTLTIADDTFINKDLSADFVLNNAPAGLTIAGAGYTDEHTAFVMFQYDGQDFDADIQNFSVTALPSAIGSGKSIDSNDVVIAAVVEPNLVSTLPSDNAMNVSKFTKISATFDKDILAQAGKTLTIHRRVDDSVFAAIPVDDSTKVNINGGQVTIQHPDFEDNTEYYVLVEGNAFLDANGFGNTPITDKSVWSFTTAASPDMFFSEFLRGSGSHRFAIELYYPSAASLDPAPSQTYSVFVHQYNTTTTAMEVTEIKILAPAYKTVPLIIIDNAFYDYFDITTTAQFSSGLQYYNHDDVMYDSSPRVLKALVLKKGTQVLDVIGNPAATGPGSLIGSGGTYVRKTGVYSGSQLYDAAQWDTYSIDTFNKIGNHAP